MSSVQRASSVGDDTGSPPATPTRADANVKLLSTVVNATNAFKRGHAGGGPRRMPELVKPSKLTEKAKRRSSIIYAICVVYCIFFSVLGVVFPVSGALSTVDHTDIQTQIFRCMMHIISVLILLYMFFVILCNSKKSEGKKSGLCCVDSSKEELHELRGSDDSPEPGDFPSISYAGEGLNVYLRFGAVGFGLAGILYSGFEIALILDGDSLSDCHKHVYSAVNASFQAIFIFLQTFFIFKYHRVVINKHKVLVRFCFMHLLATNLATWLATTTAEVAASLREVAEEAAEEGGHGALNVTELVVVTSGHHENYTATFAPEKMSHVVECKDRSTILSASSPYLYPCLIEYSLIAAAVAYKMFLDVGKVPVVMSRHEEQEQAIMKRKYESCHKANRGLFFGFLVMLMVVMSIILFFVFEEHDSHEAELLFFSTEILVNIVCLTASIGAIVCMRKLSFAPLEDDSFDDKLLLLAQLGVYVNNAFVGISSISSLQLGGMEPAFFLVLTILNFIQTTVQSIFILTGLQQCAGSDEDVAKKPGRFFVTFLFVVNLAAWLIVTFEQEKAESRSIHREFFGAIGWTMIMRLTLPLMIFYRFHSTVCLAEIWGKAYRHHKEE